MRVVLFTGKGGVGKTTAAAATAVHVARTGRKTVIVSTDRAHSLADVLGVGTTDAPVEIEPGLFALHVDAQSGFERSWREVRTRLVDLLSLEGVDPIEPEELTVLPGAEEVLTLLAVRDLIAAGRFDVIVVDCPPTAETLRLLALPPALRWYVERLWPVGRRVARSLRGPSAGASSMPVAGDVLDALEGLHTKLAAVHAVLTDPQVTSVRLVVTPEAVVLAEARRTWTALSLYGYRVDEVLANRVFPAEGADAWRQAWVAAQATLLAEAEADFAPLPVRRAPFDVVEPVGAAALAVWSATVYGRDDPAPPLPEAVGPVSVERTVDGFALRLALPLAARGEIDLTRRADELAVTVGGHRRLLSLPSALRRCTVEDATLRDGSLQIRFAPDPELWMRV